MIRVFKSRKNATGRPPNSRGVVFAQLDNAEKFGNEHSKRLLRERLIKGYVGRIHSFSLKTVSVVAMNNSETRRPKP